MASALERAARAARDDAAIYGADLTVDQAAHVARAVLMAVRDLGEAECERVREYFPGQDIMADALFSLSIESHPQRKGHDQ